MIKIINFGTLKKILCNNYFTLTKFNNLNCVLNNALHTTPKSLISKRFTRCSKCGTEYKMVKDPCCPPKPITKRPAIQVVPKPPKKKECRTCSGGMIEPCLQDAYKHRCTCRFQTRTCPPKPIPCPEGDWNRGDA